MVGLIYLDSTHFLFVFCADTPADYERENKRGEDRKRVRESERPSVRVRKKERGQESERQSEGGQKRRKERQIERQRVRECLRVREDK